VIGNLARLARAERMVGTLDDADPRPPEAFDWYAGSCPCGLPPGECREHPRARLAQRPPDGDWRTWLMLAGRGFGKNRAGSEWVRSLVESGKARRVALVAATAADARDTIVEGESGILAVCPPWDRPCYEPSKRRLTWANGAIATTYSADKPDRLRGPQHDAALLDEVCSWRRPAAFDNLKFGLRLGDSPRVVVATTPKPTSLLKRILEDPAMVRTGGSTFDNRRHLAADFLAEITARYEGTRLGRQEIHAELLEALEGAWFPQFDPARHVSMAAEYQPGLPIRLAIDCGVSRHTGAVFFQVREVDRYRRLVTVFGDYYAEGSYSEANALAILARGSARAGQDPDLVRLDPASSARTGVGPAAFAEYEKVFGRRALAYWPQHLVADGLDQVELLLGPVDRPPDLLIHPRCSHLIGAFNGYVRASRAGEHMAYPLDPNHPHEDMMDALRGGIRDAMPEGRRPAFKGKSASLKSLLY
jgi:phage terminase large subunit-like protein